MSTVRVKVCGITSVADAVMCAEAGADALGFIFAPGSKRRVTPETAREAGLSAGVSVARVGVFMNQPLWEVLRQADAARVSALQIHGDAPGLYLETLSAYYPVLRVLHPQDMRRQEAWQSTLNVTPMLDAPTPGGGQPLDWAQLAPAFPPQGWLAGGLEPENVAEAIRLLHPAGVDAVTKLEASVGVKNPQAVLAFVDAAKRANEQVIHSKP